MIDNAKLWAEGRYVDLWTVPHILAGVILAAVFNWLGISFWLNLLLSSILIISWEFFELHFLNVHEHLSNKVMDVVTGWLGFFVMYIFIVKFGITAIIPYLVALTVFYLLLNAWGFLAYKRRRLNQF